MVIIIAAVLYIAYIVVSGKVSRLCFKKKEHVKYAFLILCALPATDFIVSNLVYFAYDDIYFYDSVEGVNVKVDVLSFIGGPSRCGCNTYEENRYRKCFYPRDSGYKFVEIDSHGSATAYDRRNDKEYSIDAVTSRYVVLTSEKKFLALLFREKVLIDNLTNQEVAKYRYIARFIGVVPFFVSFWQRFFLVKDSRAEKFCQFDRLVVAPLVESVGAD